MLVNVICKYISLFLTLGTLACSSLSSRQKNIEPQKTSEVVIDKPVIQSLNTAPEQLRRLRKSLVRLRVKDQDGESLSTGFFYRTKDMLVTSLHTFREDHSCLHQSICTITLGFVRNEKTLDEFEIQVSRSLIVPQKDLIFLNIVNPIEHKDIVPIQESTASTNTQETLSVGGFFEDNPALTFTMGKAVNHKTKNLTSAIVSAGFSGSPVINSQGQLVGVVSGFMPIKNQKIGLAQYVSLANDGD